MDNTKQALGLEENNFSTSDVLYIKNIFYIALTFYGIAAMAKDQEQFNNEFKRYIPFFSKLIHGYVSVVGNADDENKDIEIDQAVSELLCEVSNWHLGSDENIIFEIKECDAPLIAEVEKAITTLNNYDPTIEENFFQYIIQTPIPRAPNVRLVMAERLVQMISEQNRDSARNNVLNIVGKSFMPQKNLETSIRSRFGV